MKLPRVTGNKVMSVEERWICGDKDEGESLPLVPRTKEHACNGSGSFREDYCSENSEINSKTCWDNCRRICWFAAEVSGASPCPQPPAACTHTPARPYSFSLPRLCPPPSRSALLHTQPAAHLPAAPQDAPATRFACDEHARHE